MEFIEEQLIKFKQMIENAILADGEKGKTSVIRSSDLINLIHDAVKYELIKQGVNKNKIFPTFRKKESRNKIGRFFKTKHWISKQCNRTKDNWIAIRIKSLISTN